MSIWIGQKTIEAAKALVLELIDTHAAGFNKALLKAEDGKLKATIALEFGVSETLQNAVDVSATMSYTAERVKDKIEKTGISEVQVSISFPEK